MGNPIRGGHELNALASRRHLLHARPKPPAPTLYAHGRTFASKRGAAEYAMRVGTPDTGYTAYQRANGSWVGVVLAREDQFWLTEHVNHLGCVIYPAWYDLPAIPGDIPAPNAA